MLVPTEKLPRPLRAPESPEDGTRRLFWTLLMYGWAALAIVYGPAAKSGSCMVRGTRGASTHILAPNFPAEPFRKGKTHNFDASNLMLQGVRPTLPAGLKIKIWRNNVRGSPTGPLHQATTRPGRKTIHNFATTLNYCQHKVAGGEPEVS